jgi:hypothetical protein
MSANGRWDLTRRLKPTRRDIRCCWQPANNSLKSNTACDPNSPIVSDRIADHTSITHAVELSQREGLCCRSGFMRTRWKHYTDSGQWQSEQTTSLLTWLNTPTLQDDVTVSLNGRVLLVRILQLHFGNTSPQTASALQFARYYTVPTDQPTEDDQGTSQFNQKAHTRNMNNVTGRLLTRTCRRLGRRPSRNWAVTALRKIWLGGGGGAACVGKP